MRTAEINRKTAETEIMLSLNLDGTGKAEIDSGVGFLDHMLTLFAKHSRFDLKLRCAGDIYVDDHHSVEDIGICLGQAINTALGDKLGIERYGSVIIPMDEALVLCAVDLSGRPYIACNLEFKTEKIGSFDTELVQEFFTAVSRTGLMTLHLKQFDGQNSHHIAEGAFKAFARAMKQAVKLDPDCAGELPSTKGTL